MIKPSFLMIKTHFWRIPTGRKSRDQRPLVEASLLLRQRGHGPSFCKTELLFLLLRVDHTHPKARCGAEGCTRGSTPTGDRCPRSAAEILKRWRVPAGRGGSCRWRWASQRALLAAPGVGGSGGSSTGLRKPSGRVDQLQCLAGLQVQRARHTRRDSE